MNPLTKKEFAKIVIAKFGNIAIIRKKKNELQEIFQKLGKWKRVIGFKKGKNYYILI